jgi:hypothetical protein
VSATTRPIVVGVCGACAGQGQIPAASFEDDGAMLTCLDCSGLGDLDAVRLLAAYRAGVEDGIRRMRNVAELVNASVAALASGPDPDLGWLKRRVSVPPADEELAA